MKKNTLILLALLVGNAYAEPFSFNECPCEFRWDATYMGLPAGTSVDRISPPDAKGIVYLYSNTMPGAIARTMGAPEITRETWIRKNKFGFETIRYKERRKRGSHIEEGDSKLDNDFWHFMNGNKEPYTGMTLDSLSVAYHLIGIPSSSIQEGKKTIDWISKGKISHTDFSINRQANGYSLEKKDLNNGESVEIILDGDFIPYQVTISKPGSPKAVATRKKDK